MEASIFIGHLNSDCRSHVLPGHMCLVDLPLNLNGSLSELLIPSLLLKAEFSSHYSLF